MSSAEKRNPWVRAALVVLGVLVALTIAAIVLAALAEDADAAAPYNPYSQAYAQQGHSAYRGIAADGRITYAADGSKCDKVRNVDVWKSVGQDMLKIVLVTAWCWNGNRVTQISNQPSCDTIGLGGTIGMEFDQCSKWGFFKPFKGSNHGAYESHLKWSTRQNLCLPVAGCWTTPAGNYDGQLVTNVFANGGFNRDQR